MSTFISNIIVCENVFISAIFWAIWTKEHMVQLQIFITSDNLQQKNNIFDKIRYKIEKKIVPWSLICL